MFWLLYFSGNNFSEHVFSWYVKQGKQGRLLLATGRSKELGRYVVRCRNGGMQDWRVAGLEGCREGRMQDWRVAGLEGCRTGGMQERRDAGKEGCRNGGMQEKRDAGDEGCKVSCGIAPFLTLIIALVVSTPVQSSDSYKEEDKWVQEHYSL